MTVRWKNNAGENTKCFANVTGYANFYHLGGPGAPPPVIAYDRLRWAEAFQGRSRDINLILNLTFFNPLLGWRLQFGPTLPPSHTPLAAACHPITLLPPPLFWAGSSFSFNSITSIFTVWSLPGLSGPLSAPKLGLSGYSGHPRPLGAGCGDIPTPPPAPS